MTGEGAGQVDSDVELAGTPEEAAASHADAAQRELHTCLPGIIKSFDPAKQTAKVQPAIKRLFTETGFVDLPECVDCPVQFPAGGNFVLTFPVTAGDECLLVFSERAIDFWWDRGGTQEPSEYRLHDLSDGFALVGVSSKPRFLSPGVNTSAVELRTRDGALVLQMDGTTIKAGINSPEHAALADTLKDVILGPLCDAIQAITVNTAVGPSSPPINAATFASIKAQLSQILSQTLFVQP